MSRVIGGDQPSSAREGRRRREKETSLHKVDVVELADLDPAREQRVAQPEEGPDEEDAGRGEDGGRAEELEVEVPARGRAEGERSGGSRQAFHMGGRQRGGGASERSAATRTGWHARTTTTRGGGTLLPLSLSRRWTRPSSFLPPSFRCRWPPGRTLPNARARADAHERASKQARARLLTLPLPVRRARAPPPPPPPRALLAPRGGRAETRLRVKGVCGRARSGRASNTHMSLTPSAREGRKYETSFGPILRSQLSRPASSRAKPWASSEGEGGGLSDCSGRPRRTDVWMSDAVRACE